MSKSDKAGPIRFKTWEKWFLGSAVTALFGAPIAYQMGWWPGGGATRGAWNVKELDRELAQWQYRPEAFAEQGAADRFPAAKDPAAALNRKRTQALYLLVSQMAKDARAMGRESLGKDSDLLWYAMTALKDNNERDARIFLAGFMVKNADNPYIRHLLNPREDLTSAELKAARGALMAMAGDRIKRAAINRIIEYKIWLEQTVDRAVNDIARRDNDGILTQYANNIKWTWSSNLGWNKYIREGKAQLEQVLSGFEAYLRSAPPEVALDFLRESPQLDPFIAMAMESVDLKYSTLKRHAELIDSVTRYFQMTRTVLSIRRVQLQGTLRAEATALRDRTLDLKTSIWAEEKRAEDYAPVVAYVGGVAGGTAMIVGVIASMGATLPALGAVVPTFASAGGIVGGGFMAMGAAGVADLATREKGWYQGPEDIKAYGMQGLMVLAMGAGKATQVVAELNAVRQTQTIITAMSLAKAGLYTNAVKVAASGVAAGQKAANILKGLAFADMGINIVFTGEGAYNTGYQWNHAADIAEATGKSVYEVRYEAGLQSLWAMLGAAQTFRAYQHVKTGPGVTELQKLAVEYGKGNFEATPAGIRAEAIKAKLAELRNSDKLDGFDKAIDVVKRELPGVDRKIEPLESFYKDFLFGEGTMSRSDARTRAREFQASFEKAAMDASARKAELELAGRFEEAVEYEIAAQLYKAGARMAVRAQQLAPVYASFEVSAELAGKGEDSLQAAVKLQSGESLARDGGADPVAYRKQLLAKSEEAVSYFNQVQIKLRWVKEGFEKTVKDPAKLNEIEEYTRAVEMLDEVGGAEGKLELAKAMRDVSKGLLAKAEAEAQKGGGKPGDSKAKEGTQEAAKVAKAGKVEEMAAFKRLKPETQKRLLELMKDGETSQRLDALIQEKYALAKQKGMTDAAFDGLLYKALVACLN